MEFLKQIDYAMFMFGNVTLSNVFFDWCMPIITQSNFILVFLIISYALFLIKTGNRKRALGLIGVSFVIFAISDLTAYRVIKPWVERLRPCNPSYFLDGVHTFLQGANFLQGMKDSYSFPSNHAANAFGVAVFWALLYRRLWMIFVIPAAVIAYSRVYVGVHYPLDILGGALLGTVIAYAVVYGYRVINRRFPTLPPLVSSPNKQS